jgi:hypothetical protein
MFTVEERPKKNGVEIQPVKIKKNTKKCPIFGSERYSICFFCAKRNSGKTTALNTAIKAIVNADPNDIKCVILFAGQVRKDPTYLDLLEFLNKKGVPYLPMDSMYSRGETDKKADRINELDDLIKHLKKAGGVDKFKELNPFNSDSEDEDDIGIELDPRLQKQEEEDEKEDEGRYIVIIDDLSAELKNNPAVTTLLKQNRHMRTSVFICSQDKTDLPPGAINQLTHACIFSKIPSVRKDSRLFQLWNDLDLELDYAIFKELYLKITTPDDVGRCFDFLFIDAVNGKYYKNFDTELNIKSTN